MNASPARQSAPFGGAFTKKRALKFGKNGQDHAACGGCRIGPVDGAPQAGSFLLISPVGLEAVNGLGGCHVGGEVIFQVAEQLRRACQEQVSHVGRLEIEITGAAALSQDEDVLADLHQVHAMVVRLSLDDFGSGYWSFSHLRAFFVGKIKIDAAFVRDVAARHGMGRRGESCGRHWSTAWYSRCGRVRRNRRTVS
ncbi:EAL domain-containing protein [Acetobacter suratthaniensis]|uniref:EAL domain-containing protein n=1 Tax=Acetobacter suratthaniensis TaxID=1502841 RepID=A0ABS3LN07_9PROT|nr:EAL domain-containing protein [Acetobacter suratthaniensis]MBO1328763.1 EAL domain-containing protein [Acetobacter suratthaniensis]MCX2565849.1 EAL domain-containing protein [Acetobacter suratthaniensis]